MPEITSGNFVLIGALLLFVAVLAGKVAYRFGAPALLIFLGVGVVFGLNFISYRSIEMTQFIGIVALCIILFTGGMDTSISEVRPVAGAGVVLATAGVLLTAMVLALFIWAVAPWVGWQVSFPVSLLVAAMLSSTDSASVFSILRSKKQGLKEHLRPLLELESGSNDPIAYMLTILLISILQQPAESASVGSSIVLFVVEMLLGALLGYLIGRAAVWIINRINFFNRSLYAVLLLAFVFLSFSLADLVQGNGYLAVYIFGLTVGNRKLVQRRALTVFFDGFTWLMQIVMFLTLGLFVNSGELVDTKVLLLGGLIGVFLIFVARPVAVFACLAPFRRFSWRARCYISWVGLRGAVPILFATYPLLAGIEQADLLFNLVFLTTVLSLLIQGTTVSSMSNLLKLSRTEPQNKFRIELYDDIKSALTEVEVNETLLAEGRQLRNICLPQNTLVVMVYRDGAYFVPRGNTELQKGDKLLVISDRREELATVYRDYGINEVTHLD